MKSKYVNDIPQLERVSAMTREEAEKWLRDLRRWQHTDNLLQQSARFGPDSIEWRDYHSKWHKAYWDLMFHKESSYKGLLELNHKQAARIMELEHDLRQARRNHE